MGEYLGLHNESENQIGSIGEVKNGDEKVRAKDVVSETGKRLQLDSETVNGRMQLLP